jgi:acyl-CoA synthetase (AMP-forming)/AMP-acid ligase II
MPEITKIHAQVREMESIIIAQPGVEDVVVISVENGTGDNQLKAFVEPAEDTHPSEQNIIHACRSKSKYGRIPNSIIFGSIPRTPSGKVARLRMLEASGA